MRRTSFIIHNKIALTAFTITQHMYSASHRGACTKKNARLPPQCYLTVKTIAPPSATRSPATHVVYHHNKITLTAFTITQHMYSASQSIFATVLQDPHATDTLSIVTWRCRSANERTHTGGGARRLPEMRGCKSLRGSDATAISARHHRGGVRADEDCTGVILLEWGRLRNRAV